MLLNFEQDISFTVNHDVNGSNNKRFSIGGLDLADQHNSEDKKYIINSSDKGDLLHFEQKQIDLETKKDYNVKLGYIHVYPKTIEKLASNLVVPVSSMVCLTDSNETIDSIDPSDVSNFCI